MRTSPRAAVISNGGMCHTNSNRYRMNLEPGHLGKIVRDIYGIHPIPGKFLINITTTLFIHPVARF